MKTIERIHMGLAALWLAGTVAFPMAASAADDCLEPTGDPARQFVDDAAALGTQEAEITSAIFDGRFVLDADDLRLVMRALWDRTCSEDFNALLADPWVTTT